MKRCCAMDCDSVWSRVSTSYKGTSRSTATISRRIAATRSSGGPDVLVAYHIAFEKDVEFNGSSTGWGPYGLGGNRRGTVRAQEILVGTLTVEMMNAASNKVVWRGVASMDIDRRANPEKREKSINKAAEKIFKNYPRAS